MAPLRDPPFQGKDAVRPREHPARKDRLAVALRENLRRRKVQRAGRASLPGVTSAADAEQPSDSAPSHNAAEQGPAAAEDRSEQN
ncbi:MAG TPA: hypothetical protein VIJ06_05165 [Methylovirgula sp.]